MGTLDDFWNRISQPNFSPNVFGTQTAAPAAATSPAGAEPQTGYGPGLIDLISGLYTRRQAGNEAANRLQTARGPLYDQSMGAASGMLSQAGNFDPNAFAADRFAKQQALVAPVQQKQVDDLTRSLYARGMLGASTYNPGVAGITPNGTPMSPELAALFAAQNASNRQASYDSMGQGQTYLDNLVNRAGNLQRVGANTQYSGIQGQATQPSAAAGNAQLLKGAIGVLNNTGLVNKIPGMISGGADWLGKKLSDWWNPSSSPVGDFTPSSDFSFA